jgi:peptide/nickel transport system substrate-binding protein
LRNNWSIKVILCVCLILSLAAVSLSTACSSTTSTTTTTTTTSSKPITTTTSTAQATTPQPLPTSAPAATGVTPKKGGILKIGGVHSQTLSLGYPPTMAGEIDGYMSEPCLDSLFTYDKQLKLIPRLALGYKVADDAKSITLTLRQGVKFHDGSDFNAEVVKWNLDSYRATPKPDLAAISSIDVINDYSVRINLSVYDSVLISKFTTDPGRIISKKSFDANGKAWCEKNPVGTGPFKFVSWVPDVSFKYERWNGYWGGPVYLDGYWRLIYADSTSALMAFKNGDFDILNTGGNDAQALQKTGKYNVVISKYGRTPYLAGDSINADSPFSKLKVRQAMSYAIDVKTMGDSLSYGWASITNQWAVPGTPAYNKDVVGYPYNLEKAKQLMTEAGYANGFDCTIKYLVSDWTTNRSTAVAEYLSKIGIKVTLVPQQMAQYDLTATKGGWKTGICDVLTYTRPEIIDSMQQILIANSVKFPSMQRSPGLEDLFDQAHRAIDVNEKNAILQKMQKLMVDDYCMATFLYVEGDPCVKNKYVHDDSWFEAANGYISGSAWMDK